MLAGITPPITINSKAPLQHTYNATHMHGHGSYLHNSSWVYCCTEALNVVCLRSQQRSIPRKIMQHGEEVVQPPGGGHHEMRPLIPAIRCRNTPRCSWKHLAGCPNQWMPCGLHGL